MNSSNHTQGDTSDFIHKILLVKACLYLIDFIFITAMSVVIIKTVRQNSRMRKEVRYFLLCHHLLYSSLFSCFGIIANVIQTFEVQNLLAWIIFGVQIAIGESVLITLTLMVLNTCLAVCWPLRYLAFVHLVKHRVMFCVWLGTTVKSVCLIMIEHSENEPLDIFEAEPSCLTILDGNVAKISGIILISFLATTIIISYFFIYREGKLTGHFNCSNNKAKRTIIIHGLQMSLHILPSLIVTAIGRGSDHIAIKFGAFVIFLFAQSFSPVVYGLRNKELQDKICIRRKRQQQQHTTKMTTTR